jgi:hypothetical protein
LIDKTEDKIFDSSTIRKRKSRENEHREPRIRKQRERTRNKRAAENAEERITSLTCDCARKKLKLATETDQQREKRLEKNRLRNQANRAIKPQQVQAQVRSQQVRAMNQDRSGENAYEASPASTLSDGRCLSKESKDQELKFWIFSLSCCVYNCNNISHLMFILLFMILINHGFIYLQNTKKHLVKENVR